MNKKDFKPKIKVVSGYPKSRSTPTPTQYFLNIVGDFKASADTGGGGDRGPDPPKKITSHMGFYRE